MIQSSRKQTKAQTPNLEIHKEISRRRFWEKKLLFASLVSAVVVFVLWLIAVPILYRLASFATVFLAALALKRKYSNDWAFSWIAKSIGLSYETALELNQDDPYKLNQAVLKRAKTLSIKLEKPQARLWWLPVLALAIGFTLLPFSPFSGSRILAAINPKHDTAIANDIDSETDISQTQDAKLEENPETASLSQDQAPNNDNALEQDQNQALSDGLSEDEALSDYMNNLKQRSGEKRQSSANSQTPPTQDREAAAQNPFNSVREPAQNPDNGPPNGKQNNAQEQQNAQQNNNSQQSTKPSDKDRQEANAEKRDGSSSADGKEQGENQKNKSNDAEQQQNRQEQTNMPANNNSQKNDNAQAEGQSQDSGKQSNNPKDSQTDQALGEDDKGQDGVGKDPTGETLGESNPDVIQAPQGEPEFLPADLLQGNSMQAGTVRLAGDTQNKGNLNPNQAIYNRSREEAISEGSIPLEYQEIIRNYFK